MARTSIGGLWTRRSLQKIFLENLAEKLFTVFALPHSRVRAVVRSNAYKLLAERYKFAAAPQCNSERLMTISQKPGATPFRLLTLTAMALLAVAFFSPIWWVSLKAPELSAADFSRWRAKSIPVQWCEKRLPIAREQGSGRGKRGARLRPRNEHDQPLHRHEAYRRRRQI